MVRRGATVRCWWIVVGGIFRPNDYSSLRTLLEGRKAGTAEGLQTLKEAVLRQPRAASSCCAPCSPYVCGRSA
eukprot:7548224-Alexandrium_andersonii.AAC.1